MRITVRRGGHDDWPWRPRQALHLVVGQILARPQVGAFADAAWQLFLLR